jgi:hypothetical protein
MTTGGATEPGDAPDGPVSFEKFRLRHAGQTLAAATGATLADLKKRLAHASNAAALRYLHAVEGRDGTIARALPSLAAHGNASRLPASQEKDDDYADSI